MIFRTSLCILLSLLTIAETSAQSPRLAFEVATIRPTNVSTLANPARQDIQLQPGRLLLGNVQLITCLQIAYNLSPTQISGPEWLKTEAFDIVGKAGDSVSQDQVRLMLQSLLADRFKLQLHRETRNVDSYLLSVGKNGHKMQESAKDGPGRLRGAGKGRILNVESATMEEFVAVLSQPLQSPVVNQTGLTKRYDFVLDMSPYAPERNPGDPPPDLAGMMITALNEILGLKLESKKAPVEILVVDHMERTPTEN